MTLSLPTTQCRRQNRLILGSFNIRVFQRLLCTPSKLSAYDMGCRATAPGCLFLKLATGSGCPTTFHKDAQEFMTSCIETHGDRIREFY